MEEGEIFGVAGRNVLAAWALGVGLFAAWAFRWE